MIYLSYECAKRIKEFLGDKAPEPMDEKWYNGSGYMVNWNNYNKNPPAYQLHDLLSKGFCKVFSAKINRPKLNADEYYVSPWHIAIRDMVVDEYYSGGLPAVEASLMRMMEDKI